MKLPTMADKNAEKVWKTMARATAGYREWRSEAASASTDGGREGVVRDAKGGAGAIKEAAVGKVATTKQKVAPKERIWELQRVLVW